MRATFTNLQTKLGNDHTATSDKLNRTITTELESLLRRFSDKSNEIDKRMALVRDGFDADETKIVQDVLAQIKLPEYKETVLDNAEQIRNKLELLQGKERLNKSAISGLDEIIKELEDKIMKPKTFGGGGTSDAGVKFSLSRLVKTEVPTGAINGLNKVYTVGSSIMAIISFGINGQVIHSNEYTKSGNTITFTTALPAELSTTRFEIIYV